MKDYYIKTKDLSVGYQGKVLIRDINLDIKKGEIGRASCRERVSSPV